MRGSPFDDLLEDDEVILWSAQAQRQKDASVVAGFFWVTGVSALIAAIWMITEMPDYAPSAKSIGIFAPILMFGYGLSSVWLALTGKGLLPPPTYAVSAKQAFIAENKTGEGIRRSYSLLDRDKPAELSGSGDHCHCRIPVVRESWIGRTSITFAHLTETDAEALLRALAKAGKPLGSGR